MRRFEDVIQDIVDALNEDLDLLTGMIVEQDRHAAEIETGVETGNRSRFYLRLVAQRDQLHNRLLDLSREARDAAHTPDRREFVSDILKSIKDAPPS